MNEAGHTQEPVRIGEILPQAIGAPEDLDRQRAIDARDVNHEIAGYDGDVRNLVEEARLHPDRPELEAALQAAKMQHLAALSDGYHQSKEG